MKYLLCLSYDGTNYHGWQVQPGCSTVQQTIQDACEALFIERPPVTGCSRTDSGVHARRFYCTVEGETTVPAERLSAALNARLPSDVSVLSARIVQDCFHPRYSCVGKEYVYDICTDDFRDPLTCRYSWQLCRKLDVESMRSAGEQFLGRHDFSAFCSAGSSVADTVRTVFDLRIEESDAHIKIFISADGFLYNMVRIIVGTLVNIGLGKDMMSISDIIKSKERSNAGSTAPAHGLALNDVFYDSTAFQE